MFDIFGIIRKNELKAVYCQERLLDKYFEELQALRDKAKQEKAKKKNAN